MTSILTNTSAAMALATLRTINGQLDRNQAMVSSGYGISTAADNAAYWSISTTMRSDASSVSAVRDAMAFGAAKIDTAYAGIEATIEVVDVFKSRIVAAMESGVDRTNIQGELEQLKQQATSIATSASFSGQNWLNTNIANIYDQSSSRTTLTTGFVRQGPSVRVTTTDVDLAELSLFNTTGGGILQKDDRSPGTIGGLRNTDTFTYGGGAIQSFNFDGPLVFTDDSTAITFQMVLDADDPSNTTTPGGGTTVSVTLNRTLMDQVYPTLNGVISSRDQFAWLVREAIIPLGAQFASRSGTTDGYALLSLETSGLTGSSMQVLNVSSTLADGKTGGLAATETNYGSRPSVVSYWDEPFNVHGTAQLYVPMRINDTTTTLEITRDTVDQALGTTTGEVTSADDLVTVLNAAMQAQNVGVTVTNAGGYILYEPDETINKASGSKTSIGIGPAYDGFGGLPNFGLLDVDITTPGVNLDYYLTGIEAMLTKLTGAGSVLGSLEKRNSMQADFLDSLMDSIERGVSRLIDADMEEASARMNALQTQQQLAIQSLQIANSQPHALLNLFR
ncbi:flagellin N-terminal helical domain-containing protein [Agrobacterium leguminum]